MSVLLKKSVSEPPAKADKPAGASAPNHDWAIVPKPMEVRLNRINAHLVSLVAPGSLEAERYRGLRHAVESMHQAGTGTVVGVCSPVPGDGKSLTSINLAGSLAQDPGSRVLLMEADLRRPSVTIGDHMAFTDKNGRGLVDAIGNPGLKLTAVVRRIADFNLDILPAGRRPNAPYEELKSPRFGELLTEARKCYDYVILDAPPVVPVPDCRLIAKWVDGFLMVVTAHRTPRRMLEEALSALAPESVLGLVFNRDDGPASKKYGYYAYGYDRPRRGERRRWWQRMGGG